MVTAGGTENILGWWQRGRVRERDFNDILQQRTAFRQLSTIALVTETTPCQDLVGNLMQHAANSTQIVY